MSLQHEPALPQKMVTHHRSPETHLTASIPVALDPPGGGHRCPLESHHGHDHVLLLKKGLGNVWLRGTKSLRPGRPRPIGHAFTLRFVPALDDMATPESCASPIAENNARHLADMEAGKRAG